MRKRLFEILEDESIRDRPSLVFNAFIIALIVFNVLAVMLETVPGLGEANKHILRQFEIFSVLVFTSEYLARLWVSTLRKGYASPILGRIKYALRPFAVLDLLAILPFYLPLFFAFDLRFIRILRLMRLIRILKVGRYSRSLSLITFVLRDKRSELSVAAFVSFLMFCVISLLMYQLENPSQPKVFSSIFASMWWTVSAMTPLASGMIPLTAGGKVVAGIAAFCGVAIFALPAGILASGFSQALSQVSRQKKGKSK